MTPGLRSAAFTAAALLGAVALMAGCATTGMDRARKTTNMMQTVEGDYRTAVEQIDATDLLLAALVSPAQADPKKAYKAFDANVDKMEKVGKTLDGHADQMRSSGNDYFTQWEGAYTNPEIREISERRRIEMREIYAKIPEASVGVKGALKSYLTDIGEIRKYLANDLSPQGIEAIKPTAQRAVKDGDDLKASINQVLVAIDGARKEMVQGGTAKGQ
jgi:hypothetical protein